MLRNGWMGGRGRSIGYSENRKNFINKCHRGTGETARSEGSGDYGAGGDTEKER